MKILKLISFRWAILLLISLISLLLLFYYFNINSTNSSILVRIGSGEIMDLFNPTAEILTKIINTDIARMKLLRKILQQMVQVIIFENYLTATSTVPLLMIFQL